MTDGTGKGPGALSEYLEDAFVEDIGLSWVTSKWNVPDELSPEDAERFLPDGGPSAWWLTLPASAVENFDRSRAVRLGRDIRTLVESPLPDGTIRTVWLGATHGTSDRRRTASAPAPGCERWRTPGSSGSVRRIPPSRLRRHSRCWKRGRGRPSSG